MKKKEESNASVPLHSLCDSHDMNVSMQHVQSLREEIQRQ